MVENSTEVKGESNLSRIIALIHTAGGLRDFLKEKRKILLSYLSFTIRNVITP